MSGARFNGRVCNGATDRTDRKAHGSLFAKD
jgi:hypothetical protein